MHEAAGGAAGCAMLRHRWVLSIGVGDRDEKVCGTLQPCARDRHTSRGSLSVIRKAILAFTVGRGRFPAWPFETWPRAALEFHSKPGGPCLSLPRPDPLSKPPPYFPTSPTFLKSRLWLETKRQRQSLSCARNICYSNALRAPIIVYSPGATVGIR
jgi:hypothetical protein